MHRLVLTVLLLSASLAGCLSGEPEAPAAGPGAGGPQPSIPGVVAAAHPLAAEAGAEILREGGNAVDAAAAVQWALNVVEPQFSGLGGGLFMLVYLAEEDRVVMIDGREVAAQGTQPDQYAASDDENPEWMGYSVGVPGTLAAWDHAISRYGNGSLASTFDPAIELAEGGFEVYPSLSDAITDHRDELASWPASAEVFLQGAVCVDNETGCLGGAPLAPGQELVQPDLAETFRALQAEGPERFYNGTIGQAIVDTVHAREGPMTPEDLSGYRVLERRPISVAFQGYNVTSAPPPAGGTIVTEALGILDGVEGIGPGTQAPSTVHATLEALKLAYADRAEHVADPAFVDVPTQGLLDPAYHAERRERIDPDQAQAHPPGDPWAYQEGQAPDANGSGSDDSQHTTHFSVVDHQGNVVSVTSTIESYFGNGQVVPGHGFPLNDELTDFTWETGTINSPESGKRPRSSMSPTLVFQAGQPVMAVGSPGGVSIPTSVTEVIVNKLLFDMPLGQAVETSRFYPVSFPMVEADQTPSPEVILGLTERGHRLVTEEDPIGNVHALWRVEDGTWTGWADSRRHQGGVEVVPPPSGAGP